MNYWCSAERVEQVEHMERVEHPVADKILAVFAQLASMKRSWVRGFYSDFY
jgi:hypothetical protein